MKNFYFYNNLLNSNTLPKEYVEILKNELDSCIYYYGNHFKRPLENNKYNKYKYLIALVLSAKLPTILRVNKETNKPTILSNAYFGLNSKLNNTGYNVIRPIHNLSLNEPGVSNIDLLLLLFHLNTLLKDGSIKSILSESFIENAMLFEKLCFNYYSKMNFKALLVPNDSTFFELLNIKIFKKLSKPSFLFLHGLPSRYSTYDEVNTDYLVVWGEKIKENYVKCGFEPNKIIVSGHPLYTNFKSNQLRFDTTDVLIVTKGLNGSQYRERTVVSDRGNLITYLMSIQEVLLSYGVISARLRVHPSENFDWYKKHIDNTFFLQDNSTLENSLNRATLVIGPTSTIFLEALYQGVNYIVYEPIIDYIDMSGYKVVNPFDGSDERVPVAKNANDLSYILKSKIAVNPDVFYDYIQKDFNTEFLNQLVY